MALKNPMPTKTEQKKLFGFSFQKPEWLEAALSHPSYRHEHSFTYIDNFDRLEFLGDSLLNFIICKKIYRLFPEADEGELSRLRSTLVSRKILARVAKEIRLGKWLRMGKGLKRQAGTCRDKVLADSLEAVFAAIYYDSGLAKTEKFILRHFDAYLDAKRLLRLDPNPKSTLQEICQKQWQKLPVYTHTVTHKGVHTEIFISKKWRATAAAKSRRPSEEKAARLLIRKLRSEFS